MTLKPSAAYDSAAVSVVCSWAACTIGGWCDDFIVLFSFYIDVAFVFYKPLDSTPGLRCILRLLRSLDTSFQPRRQWVYSAARHAPRDTLWETIRTQFQGVAGSSEQVAQHFSALKAAGVEEVVIQYITVETSEPLYALARMPEDFH
jgi:hypothetical protein